MSKIINNIVIIGGGVVGWFIVGLLVKEYLYFYIIFIEFVDIGIFGVGEGIWLLMWNIL